jgi:hypothetical protein
MLPLEVEIRGSKCSEAVDVRLSSAEVMNHAIRYIRTKGQATVAVVAQLLKPVRLARLGRIQHRVLGKNADTDRRW